MSTDFEVLILLIVIGCGLSLLMHFSFKWFCIVSYIIIGSFLLAQIIGYIYNIVKYRQLKKLLNDTYKTRFSIKGYDYTKIYTADGVLLCNDIPCFEINESLKENINQYASFALEYNNKSALDIINNIDRQKLLELYGNYMCKTRDFCSGLKHNGNCSWLQTKVNRFNCTIDYMLKDEKCTALLSESYYKNYRMTGNYKDYLIRFIASNIVDFEREAIGKRFPLEAVATRDAVCLNKV